MKIAVVLLNLGGPDSREAIRPFLFNFFMDRNIVRLPLPFRFLLAKYISITRTRGAAGASYGFLGGKSPLLDNSRAQAQALETFLNTRAAPPLPHRWGGSPKGTGRGKPRYKTFIAMRYWHPMAGETARAVRNWGADKIILLPLYPQFSTTTTRSSLHNWNAAMEEVYQKRPPQTALCCYPFNEGYIRASADHIRAVLETAAREGHARPRLLFSAHGLPQSIIKDGDPYQWQCEQSAEKIAAALDMPGLDWRACYQSRVGAQKWIGPSTEEEIRRAGAEKRPLLIYPHAFTQEHVETLVEIEIEYRELAHQAGVPGFYRVPTVSTHPAFVEGLARLVTAQINRSDMGAEGGARLCPAAFKRCCMQERPVPNMAHG